MTTGKNNKSGDAELITPLISVQVPVCKPSDTFETITNSLLDHKWDDMSYIFVLGENGELLGIIDLAELSQTDRTVNAEKFLRPASITLRPNDSRQKAVVLAVRHGVDVVPVTDDQDKFVGAIISKTLIELMHAEHLENILLSSGVAVKKHRALHIATAGLLEIIGYRLPWLVFGLTAGLGLGLISRGFEEQLQNNIAIAFFIPVVAYIADSVGTQSEAIAVRSLATLKVNTFFYLIRELLVGLVMGLAIGILGGIGAYLISSQPQIGVVLGLSLFAASAVAAVLASAIPILFKTLGKDPALGSGPLATALQDIISVVIYFAFVSALL
jgi:magnesium transporter